MSEQVPHQIKTYFITKEKLPLVIQPSDSTYTFKDILKLVREKNKFFKSQLLKHGGLLFRNCGVDSPDHMIELIEAMDTGKCLDYVGGGAPRVKVRGNVYTSTEAPPGIKIPLHNELSYVKDYPSHIYFFCEIASPEGGETILADARKVFQQVDEGIRETFSHVGLKYTSRYYHKSRIIDFVNKIQRGHKTWTDVFETNSKEMVEQRCQENNSYYKWLEKDWLQITRLRPAVNTHPETQEPVWFNQAHIVDYNPKYLGWWRYIGMKLFYCRKDTMVGEIAYADGKKIPRKHIYHIMDVLDANTVYFPWQKGDVLALDNILTMHGRAPFKGKRRVLTAMTK